MSAEAPESVTAEYVRNNEAYAKNFHPQLPMSPAKHSAVIACMDSRLDVFRALGLKEGDSHVIRNAGGVVTDDVIRSLVISQRLLGTDEIVLIHHTDCGMLTFDSDEFAAKLEDETGARPKYSFETFSDLADDVRAGIARIKADPHIPKRDNVRGFIFDVATGKLNEVT
jgi:carbonic anhydrase